MAYKKILAAIDLTAEAGEVIDQAVESAYLGGLLVGGTGRRPVVAQC